MARRIHVRRAGFALAAVAAVLMAGVAFGGRPPERPEGRPERGPERGPEPEVEVIVLRFVHIPAQSFMETLEQLGQRNKDIRAGLEQLPIAVNEPANAVVIMAPPGAADMLREAAEQLDQPNEFEMHARERTMQEHQMHLEMEDQRRSLEREDLGFRMKMEEAKRRMGQPVPPSPPMPMPMPGGPGMMGRGGPGMMGPGPGMMGRGGPGMMGRGGPGMMGPGPGMMGPGKGMMGRGKGMMGPGGPGMMGRGGSGMMGRGPGMMGRGPGPMGEGKRPEGPREMPWREGPGREEGPPPWAHGEREQREMMRGQERGEEGIRERIESLRGRIREEAEAHRERPEERRDERREGPRVERPEGRPDMPDNPLGMLLSPRVREELRLSDEQVERIEQMTRSIQQHMQEMLEEARSKMERAGPEEREELGRRMRMEAQEARERIMLRVREALTDILRPEQREKMEQLLRRRGQEGPGGPTGAMPPAPPAEGDRPYRPAVQEAPATFRLIQDEGEGTQVYLNGQPIEMQIQLEVVQDDGSGIQVYLNGQPIEVEVQVEAPPEGQNDAPAEGNTGRARWWGGGQGGQGGQNWGQMSDEERQARVQQMRSRYLFQMLRDEDLRAEAGITSVQERKIESLIKEYDEEQKRIETDVRKQFADRGGDPEDAQRREYDLRREIGVATRDAQPLLDSLADQAVGLLSDEQKERLQAASQERNRLRMACGDLYLLTTKRAAKAIGIESGQQARIRAVLKEGLDRQTQRYESMRDSYRDIMDEIRNMPPEQREEAVRSRWQEAMKFRDEGITDTRGRVLEILTPTQRDKAEQFLEEAKKEQSGGLMQGGGWMPGGGMPGGGMPGGGMPGGGPGGPGAAGPQGAAPAPDAVRQAEGLLV